MGRAVEDHDRILRAVIVEHRGYVFSTAGDSFAAAFGSARAAVEAAIAGQRVLASTGLAVRMGLHAGEAQERDEDYFGPTVNRAARVMSVAHAGQILVSSVVAGLVAGHIDMRELGEYRLRDVRRPVGLWQVVADGLQDRFPPLVAAGSARSNLPVQLSPLVGREKQVDPLTTSLAAPCVITLSGVGGIGKTRLALHAAAAAAGRFDDGVWLVELAAVDAPELVAEVALAALGTRRRAQMSPSESLAEFCAGHRLLVVLDNCEHVLAAASEVAEAVISGGTCAVLATSREPLGVTGERVWPVPSLASEDAQQLFAERAGAAGASMPTGVAEEEVIAEICRRLDGIPLAIELAAARVRSMSPAEILAHLDARFRLLRGGPRQAVERHRTLHAALQWSYGLLGEPDRELFRRLSVFAGGCTAEEAANVCTADGLPGTDELEVVDALDRLVVRSMLNVDRSGPITRYRLLESLRQFGEDALEGAAETDIIRTRHAEYFVAFAEAQRRKQSSSQAAAAAEAFSSEWDNLRAAIEWLTVAGDSSKALRLILAAWWHALFTLRYELAAWARSVLDLRGARTDRRWVAAAGVAGTLAWAAGELEEARRFEDEGNAAAREHEWQEVYEPNLALTLAAWFLRDSRSTVAAIEVLERLAMQSEDPIEIGWAGLSRVVVTGGWDATFRDPPKAYETATRLIEAARARANPYELALLYHGVLLACLVNRRWDEAQSAYSAVRTWADQTDNRMTLGHALWGAAIGAGPVEGLELLREAITIFRGVDWTQLGIVLSVALPKLARIKCTETVAAAYASWRALYPHAVRDSELLHLERSLEETFGPRLAGLYQMGATWTRAELVSRVKEEIDRTLITAGG
jgi:predicted ATPase